MKKYHPVLAAVLLLLTSQSPSALDTSAPFFTDQGYLTDAGGNPLTGTASLEIAIYDPSDTCLLYAETQNVNLAGSAGLFAIQVGSQIGDSKRMSGIDPGLNTSTVYANTDPITAIVSNNTNPYVASQTNSSGRTGSRISYRILFKIESKNGCIFRILKNQSALE